MQGCAVSYLGNNSFLKLGKRNSTGGRYSFLLNCSTVFFEKLKIRRKPSGSPSLSVAIKSSINSETTKRSHAKELCERIIVSCVRMKRPKKRGRGRRNKENRRERPAVECTCIKHDNKFQEKRISLCKRCRSAKFFGLACTLLAFPSEKSLDRVEYLSVNDAWEVARDTFHVIFSGASCRVESLKGPSRHYSVNSIYRPGLEPISI